MEWLRFSWRLMICIYLLTAFCHNTSSGATTVGPVSTNTPSVITTTSTIEASPSSVSTVVSGNAGTTNVIGSTGTDDVTNPTGTVDIATQGATSGETPKQTTQSSPSSSATNSTPRPTRPSGLERTDIIIIAVTCALMGGVLLGAVAFACKKNHQNNKERTEIYNEYLSRDQMHGIPRTASGTLYDKYASTAAKGEDNAGYVSERL